MISILFHLFFNPWALGAVALLAVIAAAIWFIPGLGPAKLAKIALDLRTWAVIAGVLAVLGFAHQEKRYNDMAAKLDTVTQQNVATEDAQKTTEFRMEQQTKRSAENTRIRTAIARAKPNDAEDAMMDAIAAERGDPISRGPTPKVVVPAKKTPVASPPAEQPKTEVKNDPAPQPTVAAAPAAERPADRAAGAAGDRLRKRPDVVVVP